MNIQPIAAPAVSRTDERPAATAGTAAMEVARNSPVASATAPPSREQVAAAVKHINQSLPTSSQGLEFSIDQDSHHTIVKVIDQSTKEVLRQIPTTEALEIAKSLDKMMGLLIKQQA